MTYKGYSDASSHNDAAAEKILKAVLERKRKQKAHKAQPWLGAYTPNPKDIPETNSPHDKPWLHGDRSGNNGDDPYDTDAGKT